MRPLLLIYDAPISPQTPLPIWLYPGYNQFVYPKTRAVPLTQQSQQNVPSMPNTLSSNIATAARDQNSQKVNEMKQTTISAKKPSGDEVGVAEVFLVVAPATPPEPPPTPGGGVIRL